MIDIEIVGNVEIDIDELKSWLSHYDVLDQDDCKIIFAAAEHKQSLWRGYFLEDGEELEYPGDNAFRAFQNDSKNVVLIFDSPGECIGSLLWLMFHELAHRGFRKYMPLAYYFAILRDDFLKDRGIKYEDFANNKKLECEDDIHENLPEEVAANNIATKLVGHCYDRPWWRARQKELCEA